MPGTLLREKQSRAPRTLPTATGTYFLAGPAQKGRQGIAELCRNMTDVARKIGDRQTSSLAWDMAEGYFGEGGTLLYFSRVFGAAPTLASRNLLDAGGAVSLIARAKSPGTWAHAYAPGIAGGDAAGEFKVRITGPNGYDETSPSFVDQNSAVEWSKANEFIDLVLGASALDPVVAAPAALAGGTDDIATAVDAHWTAALPAFTKDLGPGQVSFAGRTTLAAHTALRDHGLANNRRPLYDHPDTTVKTTLITTINAIKALVDARIGALFGPWVELPSLVPGTPGRAVPASAVVAGIIARNDGAGLSPNDPAAGDLGILRYANAIRGNPLWTEQDYEDLNDAGVNMIRDRAGDLKIFGFRAAVNKVSAPLDWQFGHQRLFMAIAAKADNILERFVLRKIDGRGILFSELQGKLMAMLDEFGDALYGEPGDRYYVDVDSVNTPETINAGEIHAAIELTMSPMGEKVILDITKRLITG